MLTEIERAQAVEARMPEGGLFTGYTWRISPEPFALDAGLAKRLESLGNLLARFYYGVNRLYHLSVKGEQPAWVAALLDQGKPESAIQLQRSRGFSAEIPRVIRPDILLTDDGIALSELDSVPGGIGLTAWLNDVYSGWFPSLMGGADGMFEGWSSIFGPAKRVWIVVSEEAKTYLPEMKWLAARINERRNEAEPWMRVCDEYFSGFSDGDGVYRFFELFDQANLPNARALFEMGEKGRLRVTPPPKPIFEEKLLLGLLWNLHLREFWRSELGAESFESLLQIVPRTWVMDPAPMPPFSTIPGLEISDWGQLKTFSHRERDLVVKISGFSPQAHSSRGVFLGNDLSAGDWSAAVDEAVGGFGTTPRIIQQFRKPRRVDARWLDENRNEIVPMKGRARLCPYFFVGGDEAKPDVQLGGCLATICPEDKKIIHGMSVAILAPCSVADPKASQDETP